RFCTVSYIFVAPATPWTSTLSLHDALPIFGLAVATQITGTGMADVRDIMGGGFLGALALAAVVLGTVAVDALNDYTGSLSLQARSEEHTSELQSLAYLVCRLLLEKKNNLQL